MAAPRVRGWRFGVFEADLALQELRKRGVHIKLSGQPFQALAMLLQRPGEAVTREQLRNALWPDEPWGDHDQRLNRAINKIRDALNDSADTPRLIETVPRIGYRFLAPVTPLVESIADPDPAPASTSVQAVSEPPGISADTVQPAMPPEALSIPPQRRLARWALPAGVLTILAGAVFLWISLRSAPAKQPDQTASIEAQPLTTYVGPEQYPAFSPDGRRIAFAWNGGSQQGSHIYTLTMSGRELRQVTHSDANDSAPVWSPDGSRLALLRESPEHRRELWMVLAAGSQEHRISDFGRPPRDDHPVAWTKDAGWLVAAMSPAGEGPAALYLVNAQSGERRRLTSPSLQSAGDLSPSLSPDGTRVAFTRGATGARRDLYVLPLTDELMPASEPLRVTKLNRVIDTVTWKPDGRQLYFTASLTPSGARYLWRVDAPVPGGNAILNAGLRETGIEGVHPTVSPDGKWLSYVRSNIEQSSIWRIDLPSAGNFAEPPKQRRLLSSTRRDYTADLSPDGSHLVFSSVRSGASEIWVSNTDGSDLRQITFHGASTPRWSPDGSRIVYESSAAGQPDIYVFDLSSGQELRLTDHPGSDLRPSWSRDSRWVYFSSARTGRTQIWKVSSRGGAETQITHDGGFYAIESADGQSIYFISATNPPSIKTAPSSGGDEHTLVENVVGHSALSLGRTGLYYLSAMGFNGGRIDFYSFTTRISQPVLTINYPIHHFLSGSAQGDALLFTQVDQQDTDLMLLRLQ